jgi:hypothetical protein
LIKIFPKSAARLASDDERESRQFEKREVSSFVEFFKLTQNIEITVISLPNETSDSNVVGSVAPFSSGTPTLSLLTEE